MMGILNDSAFAETALDAFDAYYDLEFPNGQYPAFGDSRRKVGISPSTYEMTITLTQLNGDTAAEKSIKGRLTALIESGQYDRSVLPKRNYGPAPYRLPLHLLWSTDDLTGASKADLSPPRPGTKSLPFAGLAIQRNENTATPEQYGLMAVAGGGAYIHGHASGIDLELFGQGYVLGIESGKSAYRSDIHENYYRRSPRTTRSSAMEHRRVTANG